MRKWPQHEREFPFFIVDVGEQVALKLYREKDDGCTWSPEFHSDWEIYLSFTLQLWWYEGMHVGRSISFYKISTILLLSLKANLACPSVKMELCPLVPVPIGTTPVGLPFSLMAGSCKMGRMFLLQNCSHACTPFNLCSWILPPTRPSLRGSQKKKVRKRIRIWKSSSLIATEQR